MCDCQSILYIIEKLLNYFYSFIIIFQFYIQFYNNIFEICFVDGRRSTLSDSLSYNTIKEKAKSNYAISFMSAINVLTRRFHLRAQCQRSNYAKNYAGSVLPFDLAIGKLEL